MKKAKIKILSKQELRKIILDKKISLDTLDISNITNMSSLFKDIYDQTGRCESENSILKKNMLFLRKNCEKYYSFFNACTSFPTVSCASP